MGADRRTFLTGLTSAGVAAATAVALTPARVAAEPIVLTLRNPKISGPHSEITFTRSALEAMPQQVIRTGNDYIDAPADFWGPLAHQVVDLIAHAGAKHARLIAANDFFAEVEIAELERYGAILALSMNDNPLSRRDKGPIWVMYPMDSYPELKDSSYNNRLIWQLKAIELF